MSDLISRQDAIEAVEAIRELLSVEAHCAITERISALPSAEPSLKAIKRQIDEHWYLDPPSAEAVQGEWQMCEDFDGEYGICSVCGEDADFSHYGTPYNFCPNCGAKMNKGGEDE